jgi:hypothetical protein
VLRKTTPHFCFAHCLFAVFIASEAQLILTRQTELTLLLPTRSKNPNDKQLKRGYRKAALKWHPVNLFKPIAKKLVPLTNPRALQDKHKGEAKKQADEKFKEA